ncbi:MAG: hypothetical protein WC714_29570 [Candidatus Obscuribacterales bacterium]|jgi:hypothetical protein
MAKKNITGTNKGANASKKLVNVDGIPSNMLLTDFEREQLIKKTALHNAEVEANRVQYPDPDDFQQLDLPAIQVLGFKGFDPKSNDLKALFGGGRVKNKNKNKGGSRGGSGGGGKQLPNPNVVLSVVQSMIGSMPIAGMSGQLLFGELNAEFGDRSKARFFSASYKEIFSRAHVVALSEVGPDFVDEVANSMPDYTGFCSVANTRNQAVGFVVHKRLKVIGDPISHDAVANVQGVPDLRPAFQLNLEDTATGEKFSVVVVHLKSMRGGPAVSGKVRYQQCVIMAKALGANFTGFITGDFNMLLDKAGAGVINDLDPLLKAGYVLLNPKDTSATHSGGSRLDGYVVLNFSKLGNLAVHAFFSDPTIGRSFTDHAFCTASK